MVSEQFTFILTIINVSNFTSLLIYYCIINDVSDCVSLSIPLAFPLSRLITIIRQSVKVMRNYTITEKWNGAVSINKTKPNIIFFFYRTSGKPRRFFIL